MVAGGIFEQAEKYRIRNGSGNFWSDGTALDLIWIITGWNEEEKPIYVDTDSIKIKEGENDNKRHHTNRKFC